MQKLKAIDHFAMLATGPIQVNTFVLAHASHCMVIDPGHHRLEDPDGQDLLASIKHAMSRAARPSSPMKLSIVVTHGHWDHFLGVNSLRSAFPQVTTTSVMPQGETDLVKGMCESMKLELPQFDSFTKPGDTLVLGQGDEGIQMNVIDLKGHSPCGIGLYAPDLSQVIVGDALFQGGVGRTDLPGGSWSVLLKSIKHQLLSLPSETVVLPGHGPTTTIGDEKEGNMFLQPQFAAMM